MRSGHSRLGKDPASHVGTSRAIKIAFSAPLLIDAAADADFARLIRRLRGAPGSHNGGSQ